MGDQNQGPKAFSAYDYPLYNTQTKQREVLDDSEITAAVRAGTHSFPSGYKVPVRTPSGEPKYLSSEEAVKAAFDGWTIDGPKRLAIDDFVKDNNNVRGASAVLVGQFLDELALGVPELAGDYKADPFVVAKKEALKKNFDALNTIGGVGGGALSIFYGPGAWLGSAATKLGGRATEEAVTQAAGKALGARIAAKSGEEISDKAATTFGRDLIAKMAGKTSGGVVEGAYLALPHAATEAAFGDYDAAAESLLLNTALGGFFGGASSLTKELWSLGKSQGKRFYNFAEGKPFESSDVAKKAASVVVGVPEEDIAHIIDNKERIASFLPDGTTQFNVPDKQEIVDLGEGLLARMKGEYEAALDVSKEAKRATQNAVDLEINRIKQLDAPEPVIQKVTEQLDTIRGRLAEGRQIVDNGLNDIVAEALEKTPMERWKELPVFIPFERIEKTMASLEKTVGARSPLAELSSSGIDKQGSKIQKIFSDLDKTLTDYREQKAAKIYPTVDDAATRLDMSEFAAPGLDIRFARNIARNLDELVTWGQAAGEFDTQVGRVVKGVSKDINDAIKESLESLTSTRVLPRRYRQEFGNRAREVRNEWADQLTRSETLGEARAYFSVPQSVAKNLRELTNETRRSSEVARILGKVEELTGEKVTASLDEWLAQRNLINLSRSKSPKDKAELAELLAPGYVAAERQADTVLKSISDRYTPFKEWGVKRFQNVIERESYARRDVRDPEKLRRLSEIAELPGYSDLTEGVKVRTQGRNVDLEEMIRDRNALDSFDKARVNGSRKTVMMGNAGKFVGGAVGGGVGALIGGPTGAVTGTLAGGMAGGAVGGLLGGTLDIYGGKILLEGLLNGNNNRALLFIEKSMKRTAKGFDEMVKAVDSIGEKNPRLVKRKRFAAMAAIQGLREDHREDNLKVLEDLRKKAEEISNDFALAKRAAEVSSLLEGNGAPQSAAAFNQKYIKALKYIERSMPKPWRPDNVFAPKQKWKPSDFELKQFNDKLKVIQNPFSVMEDLKNKTLSYAHVEALKEVYPVIHETMKARIYEHVATSKKPISYQERVKLSLLFEQPLDVSLEPSAIAAAQASYTEENISEQNAVGGFNTSRPMTNNLSLNV